MVTGNSIAASSDFGQQFWRAKTVAQRPLSPLGTDALEEDAFRMLADNIPTLCWIANADGYVVWYNRRWHDYCGTAPEEMEGWGWQKVHDPELLPLVLKRWSAAIAAGEPFEMTFPLRGSDGVFRPFLTRIQPVCDPSGSVARWFGVNTEISQQLTAEAQLARREAHLDAIFDQAAAGMAETDESGRFTKVNNRFCEITGRCHDELLRLRMHDITHPDDLPHNEPLFHDSLQSGKSFEIEKRYVRPDGAAVWVHNSVTALRQADGALLNTICVSIDISDRKLAEERLKESETRLRLAVDAAHMAVWESDVRTGAVRGSRQLNRLLDFPEDEPLEIEKVRARYFPGERERVAEAGQQALQHPERFGEVEFRYCPPSGGDRWLLLRAQAQVNSAGDPLGFVGVMMDITERKRSEEHQKLLVNELNHRVKNTLSIVQSLAQQSFKDSTPPGEARSLFSARLSALSAAHNLLTRQNWESASLRETVTSAVRATTGANATRVSIEGPEVILAPQTAVSVAMAVHELCTNAIKYGSLSNEDGTVDVHWRVIGDNRAQELHLQWVERGGPPVALPQSRGFGSRMIERGLSAELGGQATMGFDPAGLTCTIKAPLPHRL